MIILDTNVVSEASRQQPDSNCVAWLVGHGPDALFLTDMSIMELTFGAERFRLRTGSTRHTNSLKNLVEIQYFGRILRWDEPAVQLAGLLMARREKAGFSMTVQDAIIAAICLSHGAILATRNTKDFEGLDLALVNPFEDA